MRIKYAILGILLVLIDTDAEGSNQLLTKADSLFRSQKYTEAFSLYQELANEGAASSAMLLKMAFIQDASGDYVDALYYLDLYYQKSADRQVIGKIEEIAEEYGLSGYRYNDFHYFAALLSKYKNYLLLLLFSFSGALLAYLFIKRRKGIKSVTPAIFQLINAILLLLVINISSETDGIIINDQTLLRSGPSAGAEPLEVLSKGHKVGVIERTPVWTKIKWNGEEAYLRNYNLKII